MQNMLPCQGRKRHIKPAPFLINSCDFDVQQEGNATSQVFSYEVPTMFHKICQIQYTNFLRVRVREDGTQKLGLSCIDM